MSTGHPNPRWLLADIGGTHARFAIAEQAGTPPTQERVLKCADFPNLADAVAAYLDGIDGPRPRAAALAIAMPITGDFVSMTNHRWAFSIEATRELLAFEQLHVINDFAAQALAIPHLPASSLVPLGGSEAAATAPIAVLGPGTGLGVSGLIPTAARWVPIQGEGGHITASPHTDREFAVVQALRRSLDHVSAERLLSGMGLVNLYQALTLVDGGTPDTLTAPEVTKRAQSGECGACLEAIRLFSGMLGNVAGNLVLTLGARGGFYICGGVVPRLGELFDRAYFRERFEDHGRFRDYLREVPGHQVLADHPALTGLALGFTPHVNGAEAPLVAGAGPGRVTLAEAPRPSTS